MKASSTRIARIRAAQFFRSTQFIVQRESGPTHKNPEMLSGDFLPERAGASCHGHTTRENCFLRRPRRPQIVNLEQSSFR